ncbi:MAG: aspartyl protease family protein [candidate division WOR-3 bacterium]
MGHLYADILIKGKKAKVQLRRVLIDTGATYTVLPGHILKKIGAPKIPGEIKIELGNGKRVKAKAYGVRIAIKDAEAPCVVISFKGAKSVIGVETIESIGLKLDPIKNKLEFTRPKGIAYFYSTFFSYFLLLNHL